MRRYNDTGCRKNDSTAREIEHQPIAGKTGIRRAGAALALCCAVLASATASPAQTENRTIASAHQFLTSTLQSNNSRVLMTGAMTYSRTNFKAPIYSYSGQGCRSVLRARNPQTGAEVVRVIDWTKATAANDQYWESETGVGLWGSFQTGTGEFVDIIHILTYGDIGRIEDAMNFLIDKCNTTSETGF